MHPTINHEISRLRVDEMVRDAARARSVREPGPAARPPRRPLVLAAVRSAFRHA